MRELPCETGLTGPCAQVDARPFAPLWRVRVGKREWRHRNWTGYGGMKPFAPVGIRPTTDVVFGPTIHRQISGDDGDYITDPKPTIKAGSDHWSGSVGWYVSYDDNINYNVKVEVMRAKGAY